MDLMKIYYVLSTVEGLIVMSTDNFVKEYEEDIKMIISSKLSVQECVEKIVHLLPECCRFV